MHARWLSGNGKTAHSRLCDASTNHSQASQASTFRTPSSPHGKDLTMQRRTMNNPYFARRVWNRLRDRRPIGGRRTFRTAPEAPPSDADQLQDELAAVFTGTSQMTGAIPEQSQTSKGEIMIKLNAGVSPMVLS